MNKSILTLVFAFIFLQLGAQTGNHEHLTKANFELASRFSPTKIRKMVHSTRIMPQWLKTTGRFWYQYGDSHSNRWFIVDPVRKTKNEIFDNADMAARLSLITEDPYDAQHLPIRDFKFTDDEKAILFSVTGKKEVLKTEAERKKSKNKSDSMKKKEFYLQYTLATRELKELPDSLKPKANLPWASFSPDTSVILFAKGYNLYWMDRANYRKAQEDDKDSTIVEHQLTTDGMKYYEWGGGSYNTMDTTNEQNEMKKRKSVRVLWSPDGTHFTLTRRDTRHLHDLWVIHSTGGKRPMLETYKYQMPGEPDSAVVELHLFDFTTKTQKQIDVSAFKNQTLQVWSAKMPKARFAEEIRALQWLGDNDAFYAYRTSRDQKRIDFLRIHLDGRVEVLMEERSNVYLDVHRPDILQGTGEIVWWSERDGWGHIYLLDKNGKMKNQITRGEFFVSGVEGVNGRTVYFVANGMEKGQDPYFNHLYSVSVDGGTPRLLNAGDFDHQVNTNDPNTYFVDNYSRVNAVPASDLYDMTGAKIMSLETADLGQLFAAGYKFPEPFTVKADDGITDLYGVIYRPFDFDSTKLYPLIEYVYPGPQTESVNKSFSSSMDVTDRLAQVGFIVITVGNRGGHPNRSKWYHTYGYSNLRDYGLADKKAAAEQIADKYAYVDRDRIGITGHSGGGFMSAAAIMEYPDFFKVAVSRSGNHENNIYNRNWSERHHGVQEKVTPKGDTTFVYNIEKNSELAKNLKGHLMLSTGDIDNNVHPANTIRLINALIKANKRFDFVLLPGQRHGYGNDSEYFFWRYSEYFAEYLLGDSRRADVDIMEINRETPQKGR